MNLKKPVCGSVMLLLAAAAMAENGATNEITVTATREESSTYEVPANVTVITAEDLQKPGNDSAVDALKDVGGIHIRSISGNPSTAEITMRGFGENGHGRVLVLVDGHRMNRPDMSSVNWLQIPISRVDRIEVVRGSGTALYGDHAIGGVINVITKTGTDQPSFDASAELGSYGLQSYSVGTSGSHEDMRHSVNGQYYAGDGYRQRSGFESEGGAAAIGYDINDAVSASFDFSYQGVDCEIPGWLSRDEMNSDPRVSHNQDDSFENSYYNVDAGLKAQLAEGRDLAMTVAFGRKDMKSDMASWMSYADEQQDVIGLTPRYVLVDTLDGHRNRLLLGVDLYADRVDVQRYLDPARTLETVSSDISRDTAGAYVRDEYNLFPELILAAGGRVETAKTEAQVASAGMTTVDNSTRQDESAVDVSLTRTFNEVSKIYAKVSTVYRYPFIDEQVSYIGFGADNFYTDIEPEEGVSYEAGTDWSFGSKFGAGVTLFMLDMRDEINWNNFTMRNSNLDNTRHAGAETRLTFKPASFCTIVGSYTYTEAEFTKGPNDGNSIPLVPQHAATAEVGLALPMRITLDTAVRYVGPQYLGSDYANVGPKLSEYTVVDAFIRYKPQADSSITIWFGAENLFDEQYASLGYRAMLEDGYYPSPGATFKGGVSYRF